MGLAFALSDVSGSGSFGGVGEAHVAKVGGKKIPISELNDALERRYSQERQNNPTLDKVQFVKSGGLDLSLQQLIANYAAEVFGIKYGIGAGKLIVDKRILELPGTKGPDGKYSKDAFRAFLTANSMTETELRGYIAKDLYIQQLAIVAGEGAKPAQSLVLPYASLELEKRSGQVGVIPAALFVPKTAPSDDVLTKFYKENSDRYTIPEKRSVNYAFFDASIADAKSTATEADIADYYKKNTAKFSASQTRNIQQLVFLTESAAKASAAKIASGTSLENIAKETGLSIKSENNATKDSLTKNSNKAVADAAFAAAKGSITAPVRGPLGWYLIRVDSVTDLPARSLESARADIAKEISAVKRAEVLEDLINEIQDEFAGGTSLNDLAKNQGLKVESTPKLIATGADLDNPTYKPIPEMAKILPAAFEMENNGEAQLIEIVPGEKFALVSIAVLEEATPAPLAKIKDAVVKQWALAEGNKKAKIIAEQVQKAVQAGKSLNEALAAAAPGLRPSQVVSGTRAQLNQGAQQIPPPLAMLFTMKKGTTKKLAAGGDQGWFIVNLTEVIRNVADAKSETFAIAQKEMGALLAQEYAEQLIKAIQADVGVTKNDSIMKSTFKTLTKQDSR